MISRSASETLERICRDSQEEYEYYVLVLAK